MLRRATAADFPFIRALAGHPDNAPFLTDEGEAALAGYVGSPEAQLLIWEAEGHAAGYALFCETRNPAGSVELRRLALAETGGGRGQVYVRALLDYGFSTLGAKRVWLDASSENLRAQRTYERAGFMPEGRLRQHWYRPTTGRTVDVMLYGMLRLEWEALEPLPARA